MVRTELLTPALDFRVLEIPQQKWTGITEATVRASVEELAHINRIRFSTSSQNSIFRIRFSTSSQNSIFHSDDPKLSYASHENLLSVGSKRKFPKDSDDLRARQIHGNKSMAIKERSMVSPTTENDARPLPLRDASTTWMLCSWGNPLYFCPICVLICACTLCISVLICELMCACLFLCECVCGTPKTSVLVRAQNRGSCPPNPQSRVPAFCERIH